MCDGPDTNIDATWQEATAVSTDVDLWNYYQENFKPMIDKYIGLETTPERQEAEKRAVAGQVKGEMMKNVDPSKVSPNPVENTKNLSNLAGATTAAEVKGGEAERGRYLGSLEDIIQVGRGQQQAAVGSLQELARQSVQKEIAEKQMKLQKTIAKQQSQQSNIPCCFIMIETNDLTETVRRLRDELYPPDSSVALGYKRMAKWLVPLMRRFPVLKSMVKYFMTHSIALWCENKNPALYPFAWVWPKIWGFYGREICKNQSTR